MPRNYFTNDQHEELKKSKWVEKVTQANVQFTHEFKREFLKRYNEGVSPSNILLNLGIDPSLLGPLRIRKLTFRIREQSQRPEGFKRKENSSKGKKRKLTFESKEEATEYYKELSEQLKQENEFLKKIQALRRK